MMDNSKLLQCYCKSRELQAFFTKYLTKNELTTKDEEILNAVILEQVIISNKLKDHICNLR